MNLRNKFTVLIGAVLLVFVFGCATSGETSGSSGSSSSNVEVTDPTTTLADYLRRVSGITVQGSGSNARVFVRGASTASGNNEPLFIIDGSRAGRSFSQIESMVSVNDIENIRVLKGNEASSRYGMEGSNGVIVIRTKRN